MPTPKIPTNFYSSFCYGSKEQQLNPIPEIHYKILRIYDSYIKTQIMADSSYLAQAKKILNCKEDEVQNTLPMISNYGITLIDKQGKYHLIDLDDGLKEKLNIIFKTNVNEIMEKLQTSDENIPKKPSLDESFEKDLEEHRKNQNSNLAPSDPSTLFNQTNSQNGPSPGQNITSSNSPPRPSSNVFLDNEPSQLSKEEKQKVTSDLWSQINNPSSSSPSLISRFLPSFQGFNSKRKNHQPSNPIIPEDPNL